jgi:hypothetical protein
MHALFAQSEYYLKTYGTICMLTEDALEVIHALITRIVGAFQSLDRYLQTKHVL